MPKWRLYTEEEVKKSRNNVISGVNRILEDMSKLLPPPKSVAPKPRRVDGKVNTGRARKSIKRRASLLPSHSSKLPRIQEEENASVPSTSSSTSSDKGRVEGNLQLTRPSSSSIPDPAQVRGEEEDEDLEVVFENFPQPPTSPADVPSVQSCPESTSLQLTPQQLQLNPERSLSQSCESSEVSMPMGETVGETGGVQAGGERSLPGTPWPSGQTPLCEDGERRSDSTATTPAYDTITPEGREGGAPTLNTYPGNPIHTGDLAMQFQSGSGFPPPLLTPQGLPAAAMEKAQAAALQALIDYGTSGGNQPPHPQLPATLNSLPVLFPRPSSSTAQPSLPQTANPPMGKRGDWWHQHYEYHQHLRKAAAFYEPFLQSGRLMCPDCGDPIKEGTANQHFEARLRNHFMRKHWSKQALGYLHTCPFCSRRCDKGPISAKTHLDHCSHLPISDGQGHVVRNRWLTDMEREITRSVKAVYPLAIPNLLPHHSATPHLPRLPPTQSLPYPHRPHSVRAHHSSDNPGVQLFPNLPSSALHQSSPLSDVLQQEDPTSSLYQPSPILTPALQQALSVPPQNVQSSSLTANPPQSVFLPSSSNSTPLNPTSSSCEPAITVSTVSAECAPTKMEVEETDIILSLPS